MVSHVSIISEIEGPEPMKDALHAVLVEVLGAQDGSWRTEIRRGPSPGWWEVTVRGNGRVVRLFLGPEDPAASMLREHLKAALDEPVPAARAKGVRPVTPRPRYRASLRSASNGRFGVF